MKISFCFSADLVNGSQLKKQRTNYEDESRSKEGKSHLITRELNDQFTKGSSYPNVPIDLSQGIFVVLARGHV